MKKRKATSNIPAAEAKQGQKTASPEGNGQPPGTAPAQRYRGKRLPRTPQHVKYALGDIYRRVDTGELDPQKANAMTNALRELAGLMSGDVAQDIAELREQLLGLGDRTAGRQDA